MRELPPSCTLHARVTCIMELVHGINFVSFGAARAQDDVHVTQFWKTIDTTMPVPVFSGFWCGNTSNTINTSNISRLMQGILHSCC